jgi:hypothetical protein
VPMRTSANQTATAAGASHGASRICESILGYHSHASFGPREQQYRHSHWITAVDHTVALAKHRTYNPNCIQYYAFTHSENGLKMNI